MFVGGGKGNGVGLLLLWEGTEGREQRCSMREGMHDLLLYREEMKL